MNFEVIAHMFVFIVLIVFVCWFFWINFVFIKTNSISTREVPRQENCLRLPHRSLQNLFYLPKVIVSRPQATSASL